jgi:hypothetical protein
MEDLLAYLLSREFRAYILDHDLFLPLLFVARFVGITTIGSEPVLNCDGQASVHLFCVEPIDRGFQLCWMPVTMGPISFLSRQHV